MSMTADNLEILADHIEANVSQKQIDMEHVARSGGGTDLKVEYMKHYLETDCETTACALGHAAIVFPVAAAEAGHWGDLQLALFPDILIEPKNRHLDRHCFGANQSSEKADVVSRLREAAAELRAGS